MYYHVSRNTSSVIQEFTPRIPLFEQRIEGEDDTIPRICVAKSIEDCLSAMPDGGYHLQGAKTPIRFRVYEFQDTRILSKNILTSTDLYLSKLVLDAWITGEHWILQQKVQPSKVYDIEVMNVELIEAPFIHPDELKLVLERKEGSLNDVIEQLEKQTNKRVARITHLDYQVIE